VLISFVGLYQAQSALPELRPITAQLLRCLHLLSRSDDEFKQDARRLGLVRLLVQQLQHDTHWLDEPPVPAAAAASSLAAISVAGRVLANSPRTPGLGSLTPTGTASPRGGVPVAASGAAAGLSAAVALSLSAAAAAAAGAPPTTPFHEAPIPEDEELPAAVYSNGSSPTHRHMASRTFSLIAPRPASEAAPLRGFGGGPTPLQRMAGAAVLRAVLQPVMGAAGIGVLLHGMLLPALHMQLVGPRLSLSMEATAALKALMVDSPDNQEAAVAAGGVRCLCKVRRCCVLWSCLVGSMRSLRATCSSA